MNKEGYSIYHDEISAKRLNSPYKLRRYAHERQYDVVLKYVKPGMRVLDAGCGEGLLSILAAKKGAIVTGCDISAPNIEAAKKFAADAGLEINFLQADAENLPFPDQSFDLVLSSHVLEHLPDFDKGVSELYRLTKKYAVVAVPTCFNLAALVQCGHGMFYLKGLRSFLALIKGAISLVLNISGEGVDEGYANNKDFHHIWRYPWVIKKRLQKGGFKIKEITASSLLIPFFESLLPIIKKLDRNFDMAPLLRWCGYGTTFLLEKDVSQGSGLFKISRDKYVRFDKSKRFTSRIYFVKKYLSTIKGRVLDVGNLGDGDGFMNARPIVEAAGGEYFGLDVNANLAKKIGATNQYIGDLHDLGGVIDSNSFDAIYAGEVIEHSWQPGKIISECARILKEGGMLLLDTPNVYDLRSIVQVLFQQKNTLGDVQELTLEETKDNYESYRNDQHQIESQPQHKIFYSPASLRQLLNMHGFVLEEIAYIDKASNPLHKIFVFLFPSSAQKIGVVARKCSSPEKVFSQKQFGDIV